MEDPVADDIYSLGSTVYASMAGRPPFGTAAEGGVHGLVTRVMHDPVPPIEGLPARAQKVFQRVLAKNPAQRYGSAVAFAAALQDAMREEFQLGPGTDVAAVEESELTRRRIRTEEVVEEPTKLSQLARPGPDQTEPAGEGHRGARRRRVVVAGVGLLALFGVGGALLTVTGDDAGGGSDGGAQADDAWRSEFISLPKPRRTWVHLKDWLTAWLTGSWRRWMIQRLSSPSGPARWSARATGIPNRTRLHLSTKVTTTGRRHSTASSGAAWGGDRDPEPSRP